MTATAPRPDIASAIDAGSLERIPLGQIHESPLNPRKTFDEAQLQKLADSLRATGQLTPVIVRPRLAGSSSAGYELAAGHRRFRAAKLAGLPHLLAIVRDLDTKAFIELLNIENLQRDDLHPLEEAQGFADLIKHAGYDVAKIAGRIGLSPKYVYDRLKLLQLIPEAKALFLAGKFEAGHAILLARLSPADQKELVGKANERGREHGSRGLFTHQGGEEAVVNGELDFPKDQDDYKAVSVRELEAYINATVRAKPKEVDGFLFPDSAAVIKDAELKGVKVVAITYERQVPWAARDDKEKTWGSEAWFRADGKEKSKPCDHAVIGLVVAGPGRNEAFKVCVRNEKCRVHWADRVNAAERKRKSAKKIATARAAGNESYAAKEEAREQAREAKRNAEIAAEKAKQARLVKALPAVLEAIAEKVAKASTASVGVLAEIILDLGDDYMRAPDKAAAALVPRGRTADDFIRWLAFGLIHFDMTPQWGGDPIEEDKLDEYGKQFGVNWKAILEDVAPAKKPSADAVKKAKKAKGGKK